MRFCKLAKGSVQKLVSKDVKFKQLIFSKIKLLSSGPDFEYFTPIMKKITLATIVLAVAFSILVHSKTSHADMKTQRGFSVSDLQEMKRDQIRLQAMEKDLKHIEMLRFEKRLNAVKNAPSVKVDNQLEEMDFKLRGLFHHHPQLKAALKQKHQIREQAEQLELEFRYNKLRNRSNAHLISKVNELEHKKGLVNQRIKLILNKQSVR
jgi:hypothetical protein